MIDDLGSEKPSEWQQEKLYSILDYRYNRESDHDAMHHLSSGQLAVVSLAFCLSINKTYNISENLKILSIDDPVQEMDNLNIHSFIELIRHEFSEEYQLILSTHNDMNAFYMKYKLDKFHDEPVKLINVQKRFFGCSYIEANNNKNNIETNNNPDT